MHLVAGLGNPGREYADNRHNIGFMVADALAGRWRVGAWKSKFGAEIAQTEVAGQRVVLVKPQQYMNCSGEPVQNVAAFFQVPPKDIVIIHDEIDLEFGRLKVKVGGGHGGHNGLRSLLEQIGPAFVRVRSGVGHPGHKERVVGHVLGAFSKSEQKDLPLLIETSADAVEAILRQGVVVAMNRYNQEKAAGS